MPERRGQASVHRGRLRRLPCRPRHGGGGTIGPDLTHLGSRRSVGIDTLPLTADNLARFIRDGQHIKPGNRMPRFRIFSADEQLDALASLSR